MTQGEVALPLSHHGGTLAEGQGESEAREAQEKNMTKIKMLALAACASLTVSSAQALTEEDGNVAIFAGMLDSVTQHCRNFESNPLVLSMLLSDVAKLTSKDQEEFFDKMKLGKSLVSMILTKQSADSFCETTYDETFGPSGEAGKKSFTWFMRRK